MVRYNANALLYFGQAMTGHWPKKVTKSRVRNHKTTDLRRYRSSFGCGPNVAARLWDTAADSIPDVTPEKFLFGLSMLTVYETEENMCSMVGHMREKAPDEQTYREWSWKVIEAIADLDEEVIVWENRKLDDVGNRCLVSVDGSDFMIAEPKPYWEGYKSHKFKRAGLRYEIGLCIRTGEIVWKSGPYPAGHWHDLTIFRRWLKWMLDDGERVEADLGYRGEPCCKTPANCARPAEAKAMAARVRMRHETVNKRMKQFGCLKKVFRHGIKKHSLCFRAVAVITQLSLEMGEPLFEVDYDTTNLVV